MHFILELTKTQWGLMMSTPSIFIVCIYLATVSFTDIKKGIIPNKINLSFIVAKILYTATMHLNPSTTLPSGYAAYSIIGAITLFLVFFVPAFINNSAIGGDIKMAFVTGLWIGPVLGVYVMGIAMLVYLSYKLLFMRKIEQAVFYKKVFSVFIPIKISNKTIAFAPFVFIGYIILTFALLFGF